VVLTSHWASSTSLGVRSFVLTSTSFGPARHGHLDCGGDVEASFTRDELLTNIMLYWVTGAIGSSFWPHWARQHDPHGGWPLPGERRVEVPTAYASFPKDILHPPRALAERAFNIQRWTVMPRGGHFAALEQPETLVSEIRTGLRSLRS